MDYRTNVGLLLHKIGAMMNYQSDAVLFEHCGLGFSQFRIMLIIDMQPGALQKNVAEKLGQTEASVSRQIKLLTNAGLVLIQKSKEDKKQHKLELTSRGKKLLSDAVQRLSLHYEPIIGELGESARMKFANELAIVHDALERASFAIHKSK